MTWLISERKPALLHNTKSAPISYQVSYSLMSEGHIPNMEFLHPLVSLLAYWHDDCVLSNIPTHTTQIDCISYQVSYSLMSEGHIPNMEFLHPLVSLLAYWHDDYIKIYIGQLFICYLWYWLQNKLKQWQRHIIVNSMHVFEWWINMKQKTKHGIGW